MSITNAMEQLYTQCLACTGCGLCSGRTNVVFGTGCPTARVMFIGEGPGQQEDLTGLPFVGRAGKLLDLMLDAVDLSREKNVYIANIVKCRPPQNRDPLPEEQDMCIGWLEKQIELVNPRVIVCLGRIAAARLIKPDIKITREHGQFVEKDGRLMMATLHPAALLRNPSQKEGAFADFLRLRDVLESIGE